MYDKAIPSTEVEKHLLKYSVTRATTLIAKAGDHRVDLLGGVEKMARSCMDAAGEARDALKLPPDARLVRKVLFWKDVLQKVLVNPMPIEPDEDPEFGITVDGYLLTRLQEVEDLLEVGDIEGAFVLFRHFQDPRPGEEYSIPLPESLDYTSAYWLDLKLQN